MAHWRPNLVLAVRHPLVVKTRLLVVLLLVIAGTAGPGPLGQIPCRYEVDLILGPPCEPDILAGVNCYGISSRGDVCGTFECPGGLPRAFVSWGASPLAPLNLPAGTGQSWARGIEGIHVVGEYEGPSLAEGFVFDEDAFVSIPTLPGGNRVEVSRINAERVAVGAWGNLNVEPLFPRAFRWENGVMLDIATDLAPPISLAFDINDNGAITGWMGLSAFPFNCRAFIWQDGVVTDLGLMPGSIATEGRGINNHNQVCGVTWFPSKNPPGFVRRAFFWDKGVFTDLGIFPGAPETTEMFAHSISDDGTVVGANRFGTGFIWKAGVLRRLRDLVPGDFGPVLARDINNSGQIAASGRVNVAGMGPQNVGLRLRPVHRLPGDTNCDTWVNSDDLVAVILAWGQTGVEADVDGSGSVDSDDVVVVILNWTG